MKDEKDKQVSNKEHHYMHYVIDADMKNNPMPDDAADSIFKKILTFFISYRNNMRRNKNGKD